MVGACAVAVAVFVIYIVRSQLLHIVDPSLIQLGKCPACFGISEDICHALQSGEIKIRENFLWRSKGVKFGFWKQLPVVVKSLGTTSEMVMLDKVICRPTAIKHCNVQEVVFRSFLNPPKSFKR